MVGEGSVEDGTMAQTAAVGEVVVVVARDRQMEKEPYCAGSLSYFLGRPRVKCLRLTNSKSSTIQNDPKSSSYLTKHLCRDKLVRIAFCASEKGNKERSKQSRAAQKQCYNTEMRSEVGLY